jgi:predicted GNAT family acetyltransferase
VSSGFRVERPTDVEAFLARAGDFLAAHEAENNLMFGICSNLRANPTLFPEPARFAVVVGDAGDGGQDRIVAAALQTPPHRLVLSHLEDLGAVDAVADALTGEALPGVLGAGPAARRFAERWAARTGGSFEPRMAERIYRLSSVRPARPAEGRMRIAEPPDRGLIAAWVSAFADEALGETIEDPEEWATRWIARQGRTMYLWEVGGRPVSMCGAGGATPTGIRIGPVYTPPDERGHGYASSLVAGASQAQLDAGRRFLFLFTDLANPTSNKIYQAIGYEPVADVEQLQFLPALEP